MQIIFNKKNINISINTPIGKTIFKDFPKYQKNALAIKIESNLYDLYTPMQEQFNNKIIEIIDFNSDYGKQIFWHTTSHVLAQAILRLYPESKLAIGPAIQDGFYYDIDISKKLSDSDLENIEKEMLNIIKEKIKPIRKELSIKEAKELYKDNPYKLEIINEIEKTGNNRVSFYYQKEFFDLCRGPHLPSLDKIKAFKLLKISGAYWRGEEKNNMLTRIYGISFPKKSMLDEYLNFLEEAKKRDHRILGKKLDLFHTFPESAGAGLILYSPYGANLKNNLENFLKEEHRLRGYEFVSTPHIYNANLWKTSGHYDFYKENMYFFNIDNDEYGVKPMNCPGHMLIYSSRLRSYKDLPIKFFELGTVYRHEKSGVMHGLLRVRGFTQDDAHIFCLPSQLKDEIKNVIDLAHYIMNTFGFEYSLEISTRPEKFIGKIEDWDHATQALKDALDEMNLKYEINKGDGAFYGPKIDLKVKDALKRTWQCSTIQIDFNLPERFNLYYIDKNNEKRRPVMVHRAIVGSLERFIGILIEHLNGKFPFWLSPVQIKLITIADRHIDYANRLYDILFKKGYRIEKDYRNEKINYKIREAQNLRIPFMMIIGDEEVNNNTITLRERSGKNHRNISLDTFLKLCEENQNIKK